MEWSETDLIGRWVSFLYRYNQAFVDKHLGEEGIGSGQYMFLVALYMREGISQAGLADLLRIDKGTTAVAMRRLERAGYVRREPDPTDGRANRLFLTDGARELEGRLKDVLSLWTDVLTDGFTDEETHEASSLLKRMNDNAVKEFDLERMGMMDDRYEHNHSRGHNRGRHGAAEAAMSVADEQDEVLQVLRLTEGEGLSCGRIARLLPGRHTSRKRVSLLLQELARRGLVESGCERRASVSVPPDVGERVKEHLEIEGGPSARENVSFVRDESGDISAIDVRNELFRLTDRGLEAARHRSGSQDTEMGR